MSGRSLITSSIEAAVVLVDLSPIWATFLFFYFNEIIIKMSMIQSFFLIIRYYKEVIITHGIIAPFGAGNQILIKRASNNVHEVQTQSLHFIPHYLFHTSHRIVTTNNNNNKTMINNVIIKKEERIHKTEFKAVFRRNKKFDSCLLWCLGKGYREIGQRWGFNNNYYYSLFMIVFIFNCWSIINWLF